MTVMKAAATKARLSPASISEAEPDGERGPVVGPAGESSDSSFSGSSVGKLTRATEQERHDTIIYVTRDLRFCVLPDFALKPDTITLQLHAGHDDAHVEDAPNNSPRSGDSVRREIPRGAAAMAPSRAVLRTMAAHLLTDQLWGDIERQALQMEDRWFAHDPCVTDQAYTEMCDRFERLRDILQEE